MRVTALERNTITDAILEQDATAKIFLFGSRTKDDTTGGDIDILVFSQKIELMQLVKIKTKIFNTLPEQKIDIVVKHPHKTDPFVAIITPQLIPLTNE